MTTVKILKKFAAAAAFTALPAAAAGTDTPQQMWRSFSSVTDSTRTKVWWFHGETETTRRGITADLEAYKRAGVGGVVYYDQTHGTCEGAFDAFSPEWWQMFVFAAKEAKRVGLTFDTNMSNGFVAGGPWITPATGMKMLISADSLIAGGTRFRGKIALPVRPGTWHSNVALIAFPKPKSGWASKPMAKQVVIDHHTPGKSLYVVKDMGGRFTARSITYELTGRVKTKARGTALPEYPRTRFYGTGYEPLPFVGQLEVSDDGVNYTAVCNLKPFYSNNGSWKTLTVSFPAVTGRYFRLNIYDWWYDEKKDTKITMKNVVLSDRAMVDTWAVKAGLISDHVLTDENPEDTPAYAPDEVVDADKITDITRCLAPDGTISWTAPEGSDWVVMRFAMVSTGGKLKHGRKNFLGLECDKMSAQAATLQWNSYFKPMLDTLRRHNLNIDGVVMDSHEAGAQNWTFGFEREFEALRGYSLMRYLPVMAGYVVGSAERSVNVLFDVRRTIADLITKNYFHTFDSLCRSVGVPLTAQAVGNGLAICGDPMQSKSAVQIPQSEFWTHHPDCNYDIKECSSAANIYGKPIASAEAFTGTKFWHTPQYLKTIADNAWCFGMNEFVYCASAYQPWQGRIPGSTGGGRLYCLNRNNTYWPYIKPFWDYQARAHYMMRQGRQVTDLCVYIGENAPLKIMTYRLPDIPEGMDFDAFNVHGLLTRMQSAGGRVVLPDGRTYGMMVLAAGGEMSLRALRKIEGMLRQGMRLYGAKPTLQVGAATDAEKAEWQNTIDRIWGEQPAASGTRIYGRGSVCWGMPIAEAAAEAGMEPDIEMEGGSMKADRINYVHRRAADADIYFISNHSDKSLNRRFSFRSGHRNAEWWNPNTGLRHALTPIAAGGKTCYEVMLAPWEAGFVVLSDSKAEGVPAMNTNPKEESTPVGGAWTVDFDPAMGGKTGVKMTVLKDWTSFADPAIKHFSGTAVYSNKVKIAPAGKGERLLLRFSKLCDMAKVEVNGRDAGIVWCHPYEADITELVRKGTNTLRISVANSLMNRMVLDSALPEQERVTYAWPIVATPQDNILPSGIIGDVSVVRVSR